jgi:beta-glucanase (GH16 family)
MDGKETLNVKNNIPDNKMYIIINTAIGGNWPGNPDKSTIFPQTMLVDYIKYYTWK